MAEVNNAEARARSLVAGSHIVGFDSATGEPISNTVTQAAAVIATLTPFSGFISATDLTDANLITAMRTILTAGTGVTIADGATNRLVISSTGGSSSFTLTEDILYNVLDEMLVASTGVAIVKDNARNRFTFSSTGSSSGGSGNVTLYSAEATLPTERSAGVALQAGDFLIYDGTHGNGRGFYRYGTAWVKVSDDVLLGGLGLALAKQPYNRVLGVAENQDALSLLRQTVLLNALPSGDADNAWEGIRANTLKTLLGRKSDTLIINHTATQPTTREGGGRLQNNDLLFVNFNASIGGDGETEPGYYIREGVTDSSVGTWLKLSSINVLNRSGVTVPEPSGASPVYLQATPRSGEEPTLAWGTPAIGSTVESLGDLDDVTETSPAAGQVLQRNATNDRWVNNDFSFSDLKTKPTTDNTIDGDGIATPYEVSFAEATKTTSFADYTGRSWTQTTTGSLDYDFTDYTARAAGTAFEVIFPAPTNVSVAFRKSDGITSAQLTASGSSIALTKQTSRLNANLADFDVFRGASQASHNNAEFTLQAQVFVVNLQAATQIDGNPILTQVGFPDLTSGVVTDETLKGDGLSSATELGAAFASHTFGGTGAPDVAFYSQAAITLTQDLSAYDYRDPDAANFNSLTVGAGQQVSLLFPREIGPETVFILGGNPHELVTLSEVTSGLPAAFSPFRVYTTTMPNSGTYGVGLRTETFTFDPAININYEGQVQPLNAVLDRPAQVSTSLVVQGRGPADSPLDVPALECVTTGTATATTISASVVQSTQASTVIRPDLLNLLPTATSQSSFTLNAATNYVWLGISTAETRSPTFLRPQGQTGTTQDIALTFVTTVGTFRIYRGNTTAVTTAATYQIFSAACVFQPSARFNLVTTEPMAGSGSSSDPVNFTEIETQTLTARVEPYRDTAVTKTGAATGTLSDYSSNSGNSFTQTSTSATMQVSVAVVHQLAAAALTGVVLRAVILSGTKPADVAASPAAGNTTILTGHTVYTFTIPVNPTGINNRDWSLHRSVSGKQFHLKETVKVGLHNQDAELLTRQQQIDAQFHALRNSNTGLRPGDAAIIDNFELESTTTTPTWHRVTGDSAPHSNVYLERVAAALFNEARRSVGTVNLFNDIPLNTVSVTPTGDIWQGAHTYLQPGFSAFLAALHTTGAVSFTQGDTDHRLDDENWILVTRLGLDNYLSSVWANSLTGDSVPLLSVNGHNLLQLLRGDHGGINNLNVYGYLRGHGKDDVTTVNHTERDYALNVVNDGRDFYFRHPGVSNQVFNETGIWILPPDRGTSFTGILALEYDNNGNIYGQPVTPVSINITNTAQNQDWEGFVSPTWRDPAGTAADHTPAGLNGRYRYIASYTDEGGTVHNSGAVEVNMQLARAGESYRAEVYGTHTVAVTLRSRNAYELGSIPDVQRDQFRSPPNTPARDINTLVVAFCKYDPDDTSADPIIGMRVMLNGVLANPQVGPNLIFQKTFPTGFKRSELKGSVFFNPRLLTSAGMNIGNVQLLKYAAGDYPDEDTMRVLNDNAAELGASYFDIFGITSSQLTTARVLLPETRRTEFLWAQMLAIGTSWSNRTGNLGDDVNATTNLRRGEEHTFRGFVATTDGRFNGITWSDPVASSAPTLTQNFDFEDGWAYTIVGMYSRAKSPASGNYTENIPFPIDESIAHVGPDNGPYGKSINRLTIRNMDTGFLEYIAALSGPIPTQVVARHPGGDRTKTPIGFAIIYPPLGRAVINSTEATGLVVYRKKIAAGS